MAQYVMSMLRVSKVVPPKRQIIKDISLSFFPGAKIGLLGLNGAGKSTVLRIMAGAEKEFEGEVQWQPGISIGYLAQEPQLDPDQTVRQEVEAGMGEVMQAQQKLEEVYAAYAEPDADFDKLAEEQARLEAIIAAAGSDTETQLEIAPWAPSPPPARSRARNCPTTTSPTPTQRSTACARSANRPASSSSTPIPAAWPNRAIS